MPISSKNANQISPSFRELNVALAALNDFVYKNRMSFSFSVNEDGNEVVLTSIDTTSNSIIRTMSFSSALDLADTLVLSRRVTTSHAHPFAQFRDVGTLQ